MMRSCCQKPAQANASPGATSLRQQKKITMLDCRDCFSLCKQHASLCLSENGGTEHFFTIQQHVGFGIAVSMSFFKAQRIIGIDGHYEKYTHTV